MRPSYLLSAIPKVEFVVGFGVVEVVSLLGFLGFYEPRCAESRSRSRSLCWSRRTTSSLFRLSSAARGQLAHQG